MGRGTRRLHKSDGFDYEENRFRGNSGTSHRVNFGQFAEKTRCFGKIINSMTFANNVDSI